ncbi:MAG: hypothetical protein GMKNLPBB_00227 [Myxococcota bacterium]|nr:hypothetical protein [Myxococcota bacterium]
MTYIPIPAEKIPESLRKFVDPSAPAPGRMMAAKTLVPLKPGEMVTVLYCLLADEDPKISQAAAESFGKLPDKIFNPALQEQLPAEIFNYLAERLPVSSEDQRLEMILTNRHAPDQAFVHIARRGDERLTRVIAENQMRIHRHPPIISALYHNPAFSKSLRDRVVEDAQRLGIKLEDVPELAPEKIAQVFDPIAAARAAMPGLPDEVLNQLSPEDLHDLARQASIIDNEYVHEEELPEEEQEKSAAQRLIEQMEREREEGGDGSGEGGDDAEEGGEPKTMYQQLLQMNVAQKICVAQKGNKEARTFLMRETNKLILLALVNSPRLTDGEVVKMSSMRTMPDDVIRRMTMNANWLKLYSIRRNLTVHPKTPAKEAMRYLGTLNEKDIKDISKSKGVPAVISAAARRLMVAKAAKK